MDVRRPHLDPARYRKRRSAAAKALQQHYESDIPLLVLGVPFDDPVTSLQPAAGGMRQDPWFTWLCGCREPDAALLIDPTGKRRVDTLFLESGDPERVIWDGPRLGPGSKAKRVHGVHATAPLASLKEMASEAAARAGDRIALLWRDREPGFQSQAAQRWRRKLRGITCLNGEPALVPLRMRKDEDELIRIREAIAITASSLERVLPRIPHLPSESAVAADLIAGYVGPHYGHLAFPPIVGGGINGATLHYRHNDAPLPERGAVLIDSGATYQDYCADVTRTVPRHGRFDDGRFREVYELVLAANARGRTYARPGITLKEWNELAWEPILEAGFERYHGLGHHMGLDVHDVSDRDAPLAPGMVLTNEPGIYLPDEHFGIRIEDDLLITADGCQELTTRIPKTVQAVERAMGA